MKAFYSDIPLWILLFWGGFVIVLSFFYYRKKGWLEEVPAFIRGMLITLRTVGLFVIGLLLFGILIKGTNKTLNLPLIITVVDDSQSMLNYKDSATVKGATEDFLKALDQEVKGKFNSLTFGLDGGEVNADSLLFDNSKTDLTSPLLNVYDNYYGRNIGAIILLSDGNFNVGATPLLVAEKFKNTPFYTLAVGDTIQKIDQLVKSITHNEIAFLNNKFPVEVGIEGNKTANENVIVQLYRGDKLIDSQELKHEDNAYSLVKTTFTVDANAVGIHEYTVKINHLENEYNLENNEKSFYVEVLDDRNKVLLIAEALNPDVGAVKNALNSEDNLEVKQVMVSDLPEDLERFDLILWFDPGVGASNNTFQLIQQVDKPKWFFISPQTSSAHIEQLNLNAQFSLKSGVDHVGAQLNPDFNLFKLSNQARKALEHYPPLKAHYGDVSVRKASAVLAYQKVGNIGKESPLIHFSEVNKRKQAATYGSGLWAWRLMDYQQNANTESFDEIIKKSVQYLIVKENTSRLRVSLPNITSSDVDFIINASFYNESFEPIVDPTIDFKLTNKKGEEFQYSFLPLENEYSLDLGKLKADRYDWTASTTYNGKEFSKSGSFAIKDLALEKQSTKANHQLLKQLAENNNGKFAELSKYDAILKDIHERDDIVPLVYETSSFKNLVDYLWLLLVVVISFAVEWYLRRYYGTY